ncbi:MAG: hypothetical protein QOK37_1917 [Thermoanaerobaculia bacterium]|nr:hypothetical protein [Thermoanaerobaculia bacterium]
MTTLSLDAVERVRARIASAHDLANARFREAFASGPLAPKAHMAMQAAALVECASGLRVHGEIRYDVIGDESTPYIAGLRDRPVYESFDVDRNAEAVFEYWMVISDIVGATSWRMTRLVATPEEYDAALMRMQSPQIVRALIVTHLPSVDVRDDGTAMLEATVYTRADEERVERRQLLLDVHNEFHYHGRELIAEGRGGVRLS